MQAIQLSKGYVSNVDSLQVSRISLPLIKGDDEVLIQVKCAAANFFDILQVQGKYQTQPPFPWTAGFEFAGVVVKTGPKGGRFKVGDRVFGGGQGAYAEFIAVNQAHLLPIPTTLSFKEASTLYVTAPTSYLALHFQAQLKKGETLLVHAGAGGVGLMALQMGKAIGAKVIVTASTKEKLEVCKRFGADYGVNYNDVDWLDQIKKITKGKGCDVIYDPVGLVDKSLKIIAWNGRILVVGFAAGTIEKVAMNKALLKQTKIIGVFWGGTTKNQPALVPKVWQGILNLLEEGSLKATVFPQTFKGLASVPGALKALGSRETWGKVVIDVETSGAKL